MCGIVGYTGINNCIPVLVEGLKMLEYRGYDSAGVSFLDGNCLRTVKAKGKISNLEERLEAFKLEEMHCGIGHTRWATHGAPSDINSHPHSTEAVSLVHNGIVENHAELAIYLESKGYTFVSQTDTEKAVKLIDLIYKQEKDPIKTLFKAAAQIKGSYAFGVMFCDHPSTIFAIRKDSPLIIAKNDSGAFLASDIPAILSHTKEYCRLEENRVAVLTREDIKVYDIDGNVSTPEYETATWNSEQAKKGGFPHFMLKEIYEEPKAVESTVELRLKNGMPSFDDSFPSDILLESIEDIHIVACGTAMHAGLMGKYIIEKLARVSANVEIASEFRYRDPVLRKNSLAIFISQSGETADTLAALRHAKSQGVPTLAIVNVFGSSIAREADFVLYTLAGPEIAVASTKAYSVQCSLLYIFAAHLALIKKTMTAEQVGELCHQMYTSLPAAIGETLKLSDRIHRLTKAISTTEHLFYIGRGVDYHLSVESSLKLKEISYIHSEAYAAGELKHGTISLITDGTPVICIITENALAEKTISGVNEVAARGANVILICSADVASSYTLPEVETIVLPEAMPMLTPFLAATVGQLIAYHTSADKGIDVDKPRNLAKSVTVE